MLSARDAILWVILRNMLLPMVFELPLLALAIWWAVRKGVTPMRKLGRVLTERTSNVGALTKNVVAEIAGKAINKNQSLEFEAGEFCTISGNDVLLAVLVRNLIDNAIRYSPETARIIIALGLLGYHVRLNVEDSGLIKNKHRFIKET